MDNLLIGEIEGGQARVYLADTTETCETARKLHDFSPIAATAVGRALTGTLFMGAMLKGENDKVTTTFAGNGPIGRIVSVASSRGTVKAYCENPLVDLPPQENGWDIGGAVGKGYLTVIKDMGMGEPYIGRVALRSGEIAEDFALYFVRSEQTPCLMSLGVSCSGTGIQTAAGLFLQPLPGCAESVIDRLENIDFSDISGKLRQNGDVRALLYALFEGFAPVALEMREIGFACDCNRERIENALLGIGEDELRDIIEKDHQTELTCSFCNTTYHFTERELKDLLDSAKK